MEFHLFNLKLIMQAHHSPFPLSLIYIMFWQLLICIVRESIKKYHCPTQCKEKGIGYENQLKEPTSSVYKKMKVRKDIRMNLTFQRIEQLLCQHDGYGYIYQELFVTSSYQQTQYVPLNWIFKSFLRLVLLMMIHTKRKNVFALSW